MHQSGNKPFLSLHEQYPAVHIRYCKQIYLGSFKAMNSMRLAPDAFTWSTTPKGKKDKDEVTPESNMVQLLRCFEVYAHAICFFAKRPHVALELHEALVRYRIRLMDFSLTYSFDSIRIYHYAFMGQRILCEQDDPVAWLAEDYHCRHYLIPKPAKQLQANLPGKTSASGGVITCNKFNTGDCMRTSCRYAHICSICQHNHAAKDCRSRPAPAGPNSNSVPLGNRVTVPCLPRAQTVPVPTSLCCVTEGLPYQPCDDKDPDLPYQGSLRVGGWEWFLKDHPDHEFA